MKADQYPPIKPDNFEKMCSEWASVIKREESGTWIWPVLNAPYRRIWQFQKDHSLQKKLLGSGQEYQIVFVDLGQTENITKNDLHEEIIEAIKTQTRIKVNNLYKYTRNLKDVHLCLFIAGVDNSIRQDKWEAIDELNVIADYSWQIHVLLFLETNIKNKENSTKFTKKTTLSQNIYITPLYSTDDVHYFINYIAHSWNIEINQEQNDWITNNLGGHFLLIKDALRKISNNPNIKIESLASQPSLSYRAKMILANLSKDEFSTLIAINNNQPSPNKESLDYLIKQGWIENNKVTIPFLASFLHDSENGQNQTSQLLIYSQQEKRILELLIDNIGSLVSREVLAQKLWEEDWENHYSDWAIDKLISRLRSKLKTTNNTYKLITKKGLGFVLTQK